MPIVFLAVAAAGLLLLYYVANNPDLVTVGSGDASGDGDAATGGYVETSGGAAAPEPEFLGVGEVRPIVEAEAAGSSFTTEQILSVIQIESSFNARAYRYEPHLGEASYGLMQLLLSTARDRGYVGAPEGLYDPATNIMLGVAQLEWIRNYLQTARGGAVPSLQDVIAAYNQGVGNTVRGRANIGYVRKFAEALRKWTA